MSQYPRQIVSVTQTDDRTVQIQLGAKPRDLVARLVALGVQILTAAFGPQSVTQTPVGGGPAEVYDDATSQAYAAAIASTVLPRAHVFFEQLHATGATDSPTMGRL